jgi:hypothetical protein
VLSQIQATATDHVTQAAHSLLFPLNISNGRRDIDADSGDVVCEDRSTKRSWSQAFDENLVFKVNDDVSTDTRQEHIIARASSQDIVSNAPGEKL